MKCVTTFALILLTATAGFGQNTVSFATGQSARLVIGQPEFDAEMDSASQTVLGSMSGLAFANNTLFVADANTQGSPPVNNRVMIYQNASTQLPPPNAALQYNTLCPVCVGTANLVLGQSTWTSSLPAPCITPPTTIPVTTTPTTPTCLATSPQTPIATGMNTPTAVASDGTHLAVADTLNNRVLIWNTLPTTMNQPPDVVVGQTSFTTNAFPGDTPTANSLRGPQGVWIQNGMLFVADTMNDRVLIYNSIPAANGAAADIVLGQPNMTTYVQVNIADQTTNAAANNLLTPVSVTSDGTRLFVADLGYNRVLIWNTIPTTNQQQADVEVGQPNMTTGISDDAFSTPSSYTGTLPAPETAVMCTVSNGVDSNDNPTYPGLCEYTLSFPRFALSDGANLYIADGGNDRVLIYTPIPTTNAAKANIVLGQTDFVTDAPTDGADTMDDPSALAWDPATGNLYVADTYNQRVLVYTMAEQDVPYNGVLNSFSGNIYAIDTITLGGTIKAGDTVEITIGVSTTTTTAAYTYTVQNGDTFTTIVDGLVALINAGSGDPNVIASADTQADKVVLTALVPGANGNLVTVVTAVTGSITASAGNPNLTGGGAAASVAPGTLVSFFGTNLSDQTASAPNPNGQLPLTLSGVQVYFNGVQSPLIYVSPTQINAQLPFNFGFSSTGTANAWVRIQHSNGSITTTNTVAISIVPANPAISAGPGTEPRPAYAYHTSNYATGIVSVDGTIKVGDIGSICMNSSATLTDQTGAPPTGCTGQLYNYTVQPGDSLASVRDAFIALMANDPDVTASASSEFTRIMLQARAPGTAGNNIPYEVAESTGSDLLLTAIGPAPPSPGVGALMCCANIAGAPVTKTNAALPGENILVYATGLGLPSLAPTLDPYLLTGQPYEGPAANYPQQFVSGQINNVTTNVLRAELAPGLIGIYQVYLNLGAGLATDPAAQLYIAQDDFRSNVVTVPVFATPVLSSVNCDPSTVTAGDTTTCSVVLTVAVPTGLTTVSLSSSDQVNFPVPSSVTVPAGSIDTTFTVTVGNIGVTEDVTVTATLTTTVGTLTSTATITLNPS
ncbi:MAG TPA: hypothetical protein VN924_26385 [Bryobacteraceae bacterium]|nr:hypothetical protein [Bryobacteraceae bacterium]